MLDPLGPAALQAPARPDGASLNLNLLRPMPDSLGPAALQAPARSDGATLTSTLTLTSTSFTSPPLLLRI
jgi:hypothetical protein